MNTIVQISEITNPPQLRTARIANDAGTREQIYRLRYSVYVEEMGKPYPEADHGRELLTDSLDATAILLHINDYKAQVIASVRCNYASDVQRVDGHSLQLSSLEACVQPYVTVCSRLVVAKEFRGQRPVIHSLLCAMYSWGLDHQIQINLCRAAEPLIPFFRRLGYLEAGTRFFDEQSMTIQQPMKLELLNLDHLTSVRSPFASALEGRLNLLKTAG